MRQMKVTVDKVMTGTAGQNTRPHQFIVIVRGAHIRENPNTASRTYASGARHLRNQARKRRTSSKGNKARTKNKSEFFRLSKEWSITPGRFENESFGPLTIADVGKS